MKQAPWYLILIGLGLILLSSSGGSIGQTAPIPDAGFRVLITFKDEKRDSLPAGQKALLTSSTLRDWLDAHCVKGSTGLPEWRIWKDTTDAKAEGPIWQKLMGIANGKSEWLVAGDGKRGVSQALSADEAALMTVLTPIGGGK